MQLSFLIMWILVICEINVIPGNLLSLFLSLFLCFYMVLSAFLGLLRTGLKYSFQYTLRTPHRRRYSDFYELFPSSFSVRDQKHLRWLISRKHLSFPFLWETFSCFLFSVSFCCFITHIFKFLSFPPAWTLRYSLHVFFFSSRMFQFIYLSKNERIIGPLHWLQTHSLLLHLQRVGSSMDAESQPQSVKVVDILFQPR